MKNVEVSILNNKGEEVTKTISIRKARVFQYTGIAKIVGGVVEKVSSDKEMREALQFFLFGEVSESWKDKETGEIVSDVKERLNNSSADLITFALQHLPDELINLISHLANVNPEWVETFDEDSLFNVLEAVLEVNDLGKLQDSFKQFTTKLQSKVKKQQAKQDNDSHLNAVNS